MSTIYENFNNDYLVYSDDSYRNITQPIFKYLPEKNLNILELGCGSGAFTRFFLERSNIKVTAIDASESLLRIASTLLDTRAEFFHGYITPDFMNSFCISDFDIIFSGCFYHHLSASARKNLISFLTKNMKKGSIFSCFEPNANNPAILFQYLYETRFNHKQYDQGEFPLLPEEIGDSALCKCMETRYMDVEYRGNHSPSSITKIRNKLRKIIRYRKIRPLKFNDNPNLLYGEVGNAVYNYCTKIFNELHGRTKEDKNDCHKYDYFLSIYKKF